MRTVAHLPLGLLATAVLALALIGCSQADPDKNPVRVLAPSIRADDLVRWCEDAGIHPTASQWSAIDALHEKYLDQVLRLRIPARERMTELFQPFDGGTKQTLELELQTERAAGGVNRDFAAQIAALDEEFLQSLGSIDGVTRNDAHSLAARRRVERVTALFRNSNPPGEFAMLRQHPDPIALVFEAWPSDAPRNRITIAEWTTAWANRLSAIAERRWGIRRDARAQFIHAELASTRKPADAHPTEQADALRHRINEREMASVAESLSTTLGLLKTDAPGIPAEAREDALRTLATQVGAVDEVAGLERSYGVAMEIASSQRALLREIETARENWRTERCASIAKCMADPATDGAVAKRRLQELLARIPDQPSKNLVTVAFEVPEVAPPVEVDPDGADLTIEGNRYRSLLSIGIVAAPPSRHFLRSIAQLAKLNPQQEQLFVEDARAQWRGLYDEENARFEAAETVLKDKDESMLTNETELARTISFVMEECVTRPLAHADRIDATIAQTLADRAAAFGGRLEPALTLWRVARVLPADGWVTDERRGFASITSGHFRAFSDVAPASVSVLAFDGKLSALTHRVLIDLIVQHERALLDRSQEVRNAQRPSIAAIIRALIKQQTDEPAGRRGQFDALWSLRQVNKQFNDLQETIVAEAIALLPHADGRALVYRRTELLYPELFLEGSSLFARDRAQSRRVAPAALDGDGGSLIDRLQQSDLALARTVTDAVSRDIHAQATSQVIDDLYRHNEQLAEQSLRRIDLAVRAVRDLPRHER